MKPRLSRTRGGFTVVELMVAAALSLALAAVGISLAAQLVRAWRSAHGKLVAANQAAFVLDRLARDLESAVWRADANAWLAASVQPDQHGEGDADAGSGGGAYLGTWTVAGVGKPGWTAAGAPESSQCLAPASGRIVETRFGMAGLWLRFVAEVADDGGAGSELQATSSPRAVSYQIIRRRVGGAGVAAGVTSQRYALFRSEVRPYHSSARPAARSTFTVGGDVLAAPYADPAAVIAGTTERAGSGDAEPGGIRRPDRALVLADNAVDFGLRLYRRTGDGGWRLVFPADDSGNPSETNRAFVLSTQSRTELPGSAHRYAGEIRTGVAHAAEAMVRVLTPEGARRIEALEAGVAGPRPPRFGSDGEWWWSEALAHSEVATRWIELRSGGR